MFLLAICVHKAPNVPYTELSKDYVAQCFLSLL